MSFQDLVLQLYLEGIPSSCQELFDFTSDVVYKSGADYLDYAVAWDEVIDGWTYKWKGLKRRDPYTYLLLQFELVAEVYDPQGRHWGSYVDLLKPIEVHIP